MHKLTLQEVYEKIPERFKDEIEIISYKSYNSMIIKTKYGLSKISLYNLGRLENFSIRSALNKTEFFKNMLSERFSDYEKDYIILGEFIKSNQPILIQGKYSQHLIKPDILLNGALPHVKNSTNPTEYYINLFKEVHNNKYEYPNYEFCGSSCMVEVECKKHGSFKQKNYIHLMGSGCSKCAEDNRVSGYSRTDFIKNAKGRECIYYIIRCTDKGEDFYKMGITVRTVKKRYSEKLRMPYKYEIIFEHKSFDAGYIWNLELTIKNNNKSLRYEPLIYFNGITECFSLDLPIQEIIDSLQK